MSETTNMSIASALRRIKKLQGAYNEHKNRAISGVSYKEGNEPSFRFRDEIVKMSDCISEMVELQTRIAVANAQETVVFLGDKISLAQAIRTLQEIKGGIAFYEGLNIRTGTEKFRETIWDDSSEKNIIRVEEIAWISDLSEHERADKIKELKDSFEELNNLVEDKNHQVIV